MSFGTGGFGGFGSNNNNTTSGFGGSGFGASNNNATGGFGTNTSFGGASNTNTTGGGIFGGGATGGFGATNNTSSAFGQNKTSGGFGAGTTGGSLFGNNNASTGGGFGATGGGFGQTSNTTSGFGASSNTGGGGLFGTKTTSGFGGTSTGGGMFGNNAATGGGFGSNATNNTVGGFGGQTATAFGNTAESTGTGGATFTPFQEKESNSSITNHFQSIPFMNQFSKYSFEELRLADYAKGQKHGNVGGQAGGFGQSTGFGSAFGAGATNNTTNTGFGNSSGGGLFGTPAASSATSGFGSGTATSGGFGGGSLFNKPTTGGVFGTTPATTTANTGGGLFGGATGGFGGAAQPATNNAFGAAKPAGGLFGTPSNTTTGGFGSTATNTGGGIFGGNNNQTQPAGNGLFGNNQTPQNNNPFGTTSTTSAFGGGFGAGANNNSQAKPGGLFGGGGTGNTGNSLFPNTQQTQNTGGFGTAQTQSSGGLFGNTPQNQSNTSLFNNNNNQPKSLFPANSTGTSSLFGNTNQNQQQPQQQTSSLFGQPPAQNTTSGFGSSLFGNQPQASQQNNSLFGNSQINSSILGNSQQQQNPLQGPAGYTASLTDPSPYGSASIFMGLPPPPQNSPGPIATPINTGSIRARKPAALPQYKLNPAAASRTLVTPQKRGYGFSYSTYGTPSSVSSVTSTPGGLSGSLLGSSLGRSLGKSYSTSNLRSQLEAEPSVLGAGALSGSFRGGSGSLKRLTIDRSLRTDLFGPTKPALPAPPAASTGSKPTDTTGNLERTPSKVRKSVSFDTEQPTTADTAIVISGESTNQDSIDQGFLRNSRGSKGRASLPDQREMEHAQSKDLATVPEGEVSNGPLIDRNVFKAAQAAQAAPDAAPGEYWTSPSLDALKKMSRQELQAVSDFQVGRTNCGWVAFDPPVDLTSLNLDGIIGNIITIQDRNLTVYPDNNTKPPMGKGLNVPSTITLENCWPRRRDLKTPLLDKTGPRIEKHVKRLERVENTKFVEYNRNNAQWTFKVDHFTTYGLDDDDDDESEAGMENFGDSTMSDAPPTPTPKGKQVRSTSKTAHEIQPDSSVLSSAPSEMMSVDFDDSRVSSTPGDDTFGYRKGRRFPGAFDDMETFDDDDEEEDRPMEMAQLGNGSTGRASPASATSDNEPTEMEPPQRKALVARVAFNTDDDLAMAGAFPDLGDEDDFSTLDTPVKLIPDLNDDWADHLQHTISPRKTERHFLKKSQALLDRGDSLLDLDIDTTPVARQNLEPALAPMGEIHTSVDLMRSLFGREEARRSVQKENKSSAKKWPHNKRDNATDLSGISDLDLAFHRTFKLSFTPDNRILVRESAEQVAIYNIAEEPKDCTAGNFMRLMDQTKIVVKDGVPAALFEPQPFDKSWPMRDVAHQQEGTIFELCHILFDNFSDHISSSIPKNELNIYQHRIRKDRLSEFWARLCEPAATRALSEAANHEERALAYLSMNKVVEACNELMSGKNFRLATLVARIGGDVTQTDKMLQQLDAWSIENVISEISDPIRAILYLLAGRTSFVDGKRGPVEDQAASFVISQRFKLDWKRAFGLRLWYGTDPAASLETAVLSFADDLADSFETAKPQPWFLEPGKSHNASWKDPKPDARTDALWAVLVLVAEQSKHLVTLDLTEALSPENVVGHPMSYRLTFELHQMLALKLARSVDAAKADALFSAFAASLEGLGNWLHALWVLLFLSDASQREHALQAALARMAPSLKTEAEVRERIFRDFKIPESWVWDAKALYARTQGDKTGEVTFLARGHNWVEAHRVLCEDVAPLAIIERSHKRLHLILENFPAKNIPDWRLGGQVFEEYLALVGGKLSGPATRVVLENLVKALAELKPQKGDHKKISFAQNVALSEMTRVATEKANEMDDGDAMGQTALTMLHLPGNEEVRKRTLGETGMKHLRALMMTSA